MNQNEKHNEAESQGTASSESSFNSLPWIIGAVLVLGLAVLGGFYWNATMKVQQITFDENRFISEKDLKMVKVPTGLHPDSLDFGKIISRFEELPYVKRVNISVEPSRDLRVNISERQPIAMLSDGDKKIYVDRQGVRLPMILGKTVDVPILHGFNATPMSDTMKGKAFQRVSDFLTTVRAQPVSNATISEVVWTDEKGVVTLTNQNGVKLVFGKGDFDTRLRNWEAFYGEVVKNKGIETMRSIDLRFEGQIVTREK